MTSISTINEFLEQKNIAVAGVSSTKQKFGNTIYKELKKQNFNVFPVNPKMETYDDKKCYNNIKSLPDEVSAVVINTKPEITVKILKDIYDKGIKYVWMQQGSQNDEAIEYAKQNKLKNVQKECIMMFANQKGIHAFHAFLKKLFGKYPK